ncbi:hypothetical protein EUA06_12375 [Nocardioides glacieisoli]|uniref:Calcium-binding protein n=1 Tax=Nocardioides glacieisoli TaxID=1168730 RepID=A0A4Q2RMU0_9ACTN|nr:hypothetical protein [Nocardioides glacieisoli]RYB90181.1 hypothetical protein EUA06_12375 [Nocardioides glacieisoli]
MSRTTTALTTAALGLALLVPAGAQAAGETCQGQPATVVGTDSQALVGTEGPDVVVTNGASTVAALGGTDLVCVTGDVIGSPDTSRVVVIDTGAGDDSVEVSAERWSTRTELGDGADTFVATNDREQAVSTGRSDTGGSLAMLDAEPDVVRVTGSATVTTGERNLANPDVVDIATGSVQWHGRQSSPGAVTASSDGFLLLGSSSADIDLDARAGTMESADTSLTFSGFTGFELAATAKEGYVYFRGGRLPERFTLRADQGWGRYVAMGGGDDVYESDGLGSREENQVRGNGGRDRILLNLPRHEVTADTNRARVVAIGPGGGKSIGQTQGFEDLTLGARYADVRGARGSEEITVVACRATVSSRKGRDVVAFSDEIDDTWDPPRCGSWRGTAFGGHGNDVLLGGSGNDRLTGGPGKDRVEGRGGRDVCSGEQRRTCEKRA